MPVTYDRRHGARGHACSAVRLGVLARPPAAASHAKQAYSGIYPRTADLKGFPLSQGSLPLVDGPKTNEPADLVVAGSGVRQHY